MSNNEILDNIFNNVSKKMIDEYVKNNPDRACSFVSLGQMRYLSTLKYIDGVVGNSSSGLLEVPTFKKGTINIGNRQKNRLKATSVIDCKPHKMEIINSINSLIFINPNVFLLILTFIILVSCSFSPITNI